MYKLWKVERKIEHPWLRSSAIVQVQSTTEAYTAGLHHLEPIFTQLPTGLGGVSQLPVIPGYISCVCLGFNGPPDRSCEPCLSYAMWAYTEVKTITVHWPAHRYLHFLFNALTLLPISIMYIWVLYRFTIHYVIWGYTLVPATSIAVWAYDLQIPLFCHVWCLLSLCSPFAITYIWSLDKQILCAKATH